MATIDGRGLVDDGSSTLSISGGETVLGTAATGANVMIPVVLATSGAVTIPTSGFFQVAALVGFTGSLPSPVTWAGGDLLVVETAGNFNILLTGSIAMMNSVGANQVSGTLGTKLTITKGGSVVLASDVAKWLVCGVNGVATLA